MSTEDFIANALACLRQYLETGNRDMLERAIALLERAEKR